MSAGYRIWPAAVLAVAATAAVAVLTGTQAGAGPDACTAGRQWVSVAPLVVGDTVAAGVGGSSEASWRRAVKLESELAPVLTGCLDVRRITPVSPADLPDARS